MCLNIYVWSVKVSMLLMDVSGFHDRPWAQVCTGTQARPGQPRAYKQKGYREYQSFLSEQPNVKMYILLENTKVQPCISFSEAIIKDVLTLWLLIICHESPHYWHPPHRQPFLFPSYKVHSCKQVCNLHSLCRQREELFDWMLGLGYDWQWQCRKYHT